METWSHRWWR